MYFLKILRVWYEDSVMYIIDSNVIKCFNYRKTEKLKHSLLCDVPTKRGPLLEFVKAICHIFSLDTALHEPVYILKNNLLCLIGKKSLIFTQFVFFNEI